MTMAQLVASVEKIPPGVSLEFEVFSSPACLLTMMRLSVPF